MFLIALITLCVSSPCFYSNSKVAVTLAQEACLLINICCIAFPCTFKCKQLSLNSKQAFGTVQVVVWLQPKFGSCFHFLWLFFVGIGVLVWKSSFENYLRLLTLLSWFKYQCASNISFTPLLIRFLRLRVHFSTISYSRNETRKYTFAPKSYMLENDGRKCVYCIRNNFSVRSATGNKY